VLEILATLQTGEGDVVLVLISSKLFKNDMTKLLENGWMTSQEVENPAKK